VIGAWGSYRFPANCVAPVVRKETLKTGAGVPYAERVAFEVDGEFLSNPNSANPQADFANACTLLEANLRIPYRDFVVYRDDGGVFLQLRNATSTSGVTCDGLEYPKGDGAEGVTVRSFRFRVSAEYALPNSGRLYDEWQEQVVYSGGGPLFRHKQPVRGYPVKQQVFEHTPFRAVQAGTAVGIGFVPPLPPALFPALLVEAPTVTPVSPKRDGKTFIGFRISWVYNFESALPIPRLAPHLPPA
jgi:hypothetical protein